MEITDLQGRNYQDYTAFSSYQFDDGIEVVPLCKKATDPPPHFILVRRHAPTGIRTVEVSGTKTGAPPVMPDMINTPSGDVFLGADVSILHPLTNETAGIRTFRTDGTYRFAQHGALGLARNMTPEPAVAPTSTLRTPPMLHAGRPPYIRAVVDALACILAGMMGPGSRAASVVITGLNRALNLLGASTARPQLNDPGYKDMAVDTRPDYFSEGLIR